MSSLLRCLSISPVSLPPSSPRRAWGRWGRSCALGWTTLERLGGVSTLERGDECPLPDIQRQERLDDYKKFLVKALNTSDEDLS
jgi:hypothetical protein